VRFYVAGTNSLRSTVITSFKTSCKKGSPVKHKIVRSACVLILLAVCGVASLSLQPATAANGKRKPPPKTQPKSKPTTTRFDTAGLPKWLAEVIVKADIVSVYTYSIRSESFYLLVPSCCDRYTTAHTSAGTYICAPSGGFVGSGANDCPEEHKNPANQKLVWQKPTK
jgi:hypothetical protein